MYSEVSYEKTEKSPPSNKNIPVRNLKDHIANLSSNDCAGFKSEYEVRFSTMILFPFDDFLYNGECQLPSDLSSIKLL